MWFSKGTSKKSLCESDLNQIIYYYPYIIEVISLYPIWCNYIRFSKA